MALVTFVLTRKTKTTYQKEDGTYFDTPVSHRLLPEYVMRKEDGTTLKCRHIRSENSIYVKDQTNSTFLHKNDNLYFTNGLLIADDEKNKNTVEFLRNDPRNEATPKNLRPSNVQVVFREVQHAKEGTNEIDRILLEQQAVKMVTDLQTGNEKEGYTYNIPKLNLMVKVFREDGSMPPSKQIVALVKKAKANPVDFMYTIQQEWGDVEAEIESAIMFKIIETDKNTAWLNKEVIYTSDKKLSQKEMQGEIIAYLLSPSGMEKYNSLKDLLQKAKEAPTPAPKPAT